MDSEEHHHIENLIANGRPANDEGPFYHHTFWESYKGSVKGKLGGLIIGGTIGLLVGGIAVGILSLIPGIIIAPIALGIIGGVSVAGMMYGAHEFSEVGREAGAVAAGLNDLEKRNQQFEISKFSEIKKELGEIKAMVAGREAANEPNYQNTVTITTPPVANDANYENVPSLAETQEKLQDYRTTHHRDDPLKQKGPFFWKVALIGAVVGACVGLILATPVGGGAAISALEHIGLGELAKVGSAKLIASTVIFGTIGASFGISRDIFRMVFDKTDLLFKGMVDSNKAPVKEPEIAQKTTQTVTLDRQPRVRTIVYPDMIDYPTSETHWQDKNPQSEKDFAVRARQALESLDHTQMRGH